MLNAYLRAIIEEMNKDGICGLRAIVDIPIGQRQPREDSPFDHVYVNQKTGACEDSYYGEIYIPVEDGKYLECAGLTARV